MNKESKLDVEKDKWVQIKFSCFFFLLRTFVYRGISESRSAERDKEVVYKIINI